MVPDLARNGIALVAISYDSVDVLRSFAAEYGITYPLLSDEGSRTLRRLRLINNRVQEDHAAYGIQPDTSTCRIPVPSSSIAMGSSSRSASTRAIASGTPGPG